MDLALLQGGWRQSEMSATVASLHYYFILSWYNQIIQIPLTVIETIFSLSQASFSVLYILLSPKAVNKELLYAFRKFHWIQDVGLYPLEDITVCSTFPFAINRISNIVKTPSKSKTSRGNILN